MTYGLIVRVFVVSLRKMKLIELNIASIIALCKQYRVKTLAVFGSILTDKFSNESDVDMLVDFEAANPDEWDYVDNYFGLRDALQSLFGRKVDLIERKGIRNPLFKKSIEAKQRLIYG